MYFKWLLVSTIEEHAIMFALHGFDLIKLSDDAHEYEVVRLSGNMLEFHWYTNMWNHLYG